MKLWEGPDLLSGHTSHVISPHQLSSCDVYSSLELVVMAPLLNVHSSLLLQGLLKAVVYDIIDQLAVLLPPVEVPVCPQLTELLQVKDILM